MDNYCEGIYDGSRAYAFRVSIIALACNAMSIIYVPMEALTTRTLTAILVRFDVSTHWRLYMICGLLSGCSLQQLSTNTEDVSITVFPLYSRQILDNLSTFIDEPYAVPSQSDIQTGTILTSNSITPSLTFPITSTFGRTLTSAAAFTKADARTTNGAGGTLSGSEGWQQNWNITPLTDANTLRNLRALYRFVIYSADLRSEYHVPRLESGSQLIEDSYDLTEPQCILCTSGHLINRRLKSGWLYWTNEAGAVSGENPPPANVPVTDLGVHGSHHLYMTRDDFDRGYLSNFVLFTMPNAEPAQVAGGGGSKANTPGTVSGRVPPAPNRGNAAPPPVPPPPTF